MPDDTPPATGNRQSLSKPATAFSLALTPEQKDIRDRAHAFARDVIRPAAQEWDKREELPWPVLEQAAQAGFYSLEMYGKALMDPTGLTMQLITEEFFWGDAGIGLAILYPLLPLVALFKGGTPEQFGKWAPEMFGEPGNIKLASFALSEPQAGSDAGAISTSATYNEARDEWTINGVKTWIGNGGIADVTIVIATVDPELRARGHAAFVVPKGTPGFSMVKKLEKLGLHASHTGMISFDNVVIPGSNLLGGKAKLDRQIGVARDRLAAKRSGAVVEELATGKSSFDVLEASRPGVAAQAVGIARAAIEDMVEFARERETFGAPLIERQKVAMDIAQMQAELHAARLASWCGAWMAATGQSMDVGEGSSAKLLASQLAQKATTAAVLLKGGIGFIDPDTGRRYRDAPITRIYEGAENVLLGAIAQKTTGVQVLY